MTAMQVVGLYGALLTLLAAVIMGFTGYARSKAKVAVGDGGDENLLKAMRSHANFVESTPLALVGLVLLASLQASTLLLHIAGALFVAGRLLHFLGMGVGVLPVGRVMGAIATQLTFLMITITLFLKVFS